MNEDTQDVIDTLNAAADHVRMKGLHNSGGWGAIHAADGPCCLLGSIQMVRPDGDPNFDSTSIWHQACEAVGAVLNDKSPHASRLIAPWNDTLGRTADEVITVLMEAAARLRESR